MRTRIKSKVSLLFVAFAALLAVPAIALADQISNNIDTTVDAVAEAMPLTAGGANGTTQLYVIPKNGDGKNGCNLTGDSTLAISLSSSNTNVATVSPSSVTFNSCGDTPTLTVTPHNQGSATITASLVPGGNTTGGTFDLAPVAFTVNVAPPPNTPPKVVVAGVTGGESYNKGSVPNATCQVTDAEDGNSSFPATLSAISGPYASDGIGLQTASCSYTDGGGLTAEASEVYGIVDPTPPNIGYNLNPASPNGSNGWYKGNVSLDWTVSEPQSPNSLQKTGCVDQNITSDQGPTTYSCSATSAGGSTGPVSVTIQRDATPPTNVQFSGGGISNGASYDFGDVPAGPSGCTASDATSGLDTCNVTGYGTAVGTHTLTATATDNAGNQATKQITYTVKPWTLTGFYQPVDMNILNNAKAGSTVPLKFEIFKGSTELTDTNVIRSFQQKINCTAGTGDDIEQYATGSTSLRYDSTAGQFVFNWQTPKAAGSCYRVTLTTNDGSTLVADFRLK